MTNIDLDFNYLVFQPNPRRDQVYIWIDGEKLRRVMSLPNFYALIYRKQPEVAGQIQQVCNTYSFYIWSMLDKTVTHLTLMSRDAPYRDSLNAHLSGRVPVVVDKKSTLIDQLARYGFSMPTEDSINNLKVALTPVADNEGGFLSRFFVKSKSPMHKRDF